MIKLITPFEETSKKIAVIQFSILILFWFLSGSHYIPSIAEVAKGGYDIIVNQGAVRHFLLSITFCIKGIFFAAIFSLLLAYGLLIPITNPICSFFTKFRFLPTIGISFLFMKLTHDVQEQKTWLITFGIMTFLTDSMCKVIIQRDKDKDDYATTLGLSPWMKMKELIILEKLPYMITAIGSNLAIAWTMLATVENLCKIDGGIGVLLAEQNKYFKFEKVYAILILILLTGIALDAIFRWLIWWLFPYKRKDGR
jgi:ABC-type nitrate/sulfonate/bicarbonate transport system permease component